MKDEDTMNTIQLVGSTLTVFGSTWLGNKPTTFQFQCEPLNHWGVKKRKAISCFQSFLLRSSHGAQVSEDFDEKIAAAFRWKAGHSLTVPSFGTRPSSFKSKATWTGMELANLKCLRLKYSHLSLGHSVGVGCFTRGRSEGREREEDEDVQLPSLLVLQLTAQLAVA